MRLDLSKEQIQAIISSLGSSISDLERDRDNQNIISGSVKDIVEEAITVKLSTKLYLDNYLKENK